MKIVILDGYVDEPSNLGVPPFISPYPRYLAGAITDAGHEYKYLTIDRVREGARLKGDIFVVISGPIVPGKYIRGMPASEKELLSLASSFKGTKVLGGPLSRFRKYDVGTAKAYDYVARRDLDACIYDLLVNGKFDDRDRSMDEWGRWAVQGAKVVTHHPDFPEPLIVELDLSKGCVRYLTGGCSFCIEPMYGAPKFRQVETIVDEVKELASYGVVNFRLGGTADIFSYMADGIGRTPTPKPNVAILKELLTGIRNAAPGLKVFHTDNADPAIIAAHPDEATATLKELIKNTTPGNILSLGMETADPAVVDANNLNATAEMSLEAVRLINTVGRERGENGLPYLLPGLNFVLGLDGETTRTFELNLKFLKNVLDEGLLVRRVNIRQVSSVRREFDMRNRRMFRSFKNSVRIKFDHEMLERVVPTGTVMRSVYTEIKEGKTTFGRQVGTYPLLIGIPYTIVLGSFINVKVTGHGQRSVTAIEYPLDVNHSPMAALAAIPGIGAKRAARIVRARPIKSKKELESCLDEPAIAFAVATYLDLPAR